MKKIITIFLIIITYSLSLNALESKFSTTDEYGSSSGTFRFTSNISSRCGVVFNSSSGITFKNENPSKIGDFELISNNPNNPYVDIKFKRVKKSKNLKNIPNHKINVIIDRKNKYNLDELIRNTIRLKKGKHQIHLTIDEEKMRIPVGRVELSLRIKASCR